MKYTLTMLVVLFLLSSCKTSENKLLTYSLKVKENKVLLTEKYEQEGLSMETLSLLKVYSDNYSFLADALAGAVKKKKGRNALLKYLKKSDDLKTICESHNLSDEFYSSLQRDCRVGYFDICPVKFSKYLEKRGEILNAIKAVGNDEFLSKTDCGFGNLGFLK